MTQIEVYSVGHSTLPYEQFLDLLRAHKITAVADVRSAPTSRRFPQFNKGTLRQRLKEDDIAYVFLGTELGGRPSNPTLYSKDIADYEKMALTPSFQSGIGRVIEGAEKYRIALMCSEQDPVDCHRCLLVSRALKEKNVAVKHILGDRRIASHDQIEKQLLADIDNTAELFDHDDPLARAYRKRAQKVAFRLDSRPANQVAAE